ncbi:MAG TPA: response regulator [Rhizomicrobium sp.]|nr:response regulator [Rhizomicrobium sp.]
MQQVPGEQAPLGHDGIARAPTILVVDDEALIRMAASDFLQECGFRVLEAANAREAVEMIRAYAVVIDLVFSDVIMPGEMDGFGLAAWIGERYPAIPVILCSGDARKAALAREMLARERFFAKPYDLEAVATTIRWTIDGRAAH